MRWKLTGSCNLSEDDANLNSSKLQIKFLFGNCVKSRFDEPLHMCWLYTRNSFRGNESLYQGTKWISIRKAQPLHSVYIHTLHKDYNYRTHLKDKFWQVLQVINKRLPLDIWLLLYMYTSQAYLRTAHNHGPPKAHDDSCIGYVNFILTQEAGHN